MSQAKDESSAEGATSNDVLYGNSLEDAYAKGVERGASKWRIFALTRLVQVRDKMPDADVEVVQRFLGVVDL